MDEKEEEASVGTLTPDTTNHDGISSKQYSKRYAYRNVYGLGIALLLNMAAVLGLFGLQSSINKREGLGLASLSVTYGSSTFIGFVTAGLLTIFGTKFSLVIGLGSRLVYTLCSYYPTWYTLIPGAALSGLGSTITWASVTAHITGVAELIAPSLNKDRAYLVSKYTGIIFFFYYFANIPGNLASSLIFYPYNYNSTEDLPYSVSNGSKNYSCGKENSGKLGDIYIYSLLAVYVAFIIASVFILIFCVDHLPMKNSFFSTDQKFQVYFRKPFIQLLRVLIDKRMLLIAPIIFASGMLDTFAFGTFTEHFVSDCFDIYLVGFALIVFSVSCSAMSLAYGRVVKVVPRYIVVLFGAALAVGVIIFIEIWDRVPSYGFIFTFGVVWGIANAIWITSATSLPGILFPDCAEVAYSTYYIYSSFFYSVGYGTAKVLNVTQLWATFALVIIALFCELTIEIFIRREKRCFHVKDSTVTPPVGVNVLFPIYQSRSSSPILLARTVHIDFKTQDHQEIRQIESSGLKLGPQEEAYLNPSPMCIAKNVLQRKLYHKRPPFAVTGAKTATSLPDTTNTHSGGIVN